MKTLTLSAAALALILSSGMSLAENAVGTGNDATSGVKAGSNDKSVCTNLETTPADQIPDHCRDVTGSGAAQDSMTTGTTDPAPLATETDENTDNTPGDGKKNNSVNP